MATTEQRLREYEDLYKQAQGYDTNKYQQDFQKAYNEAMNYNQDLINQKSSSLGELQAVAPTLREKYSNSLITDPTKQMSLIAQARQAPITNWGQAVDLIGARGGKYSDILGKATSGYQTAAQQANTAAENAWRLYQDAVQQDQFRQSQRGSGGGTNLADLINSLIGGGDQNTEDTNRYEIPEGGIATKNGRIDTKADSLGNSFKNRLANQVLNQRSASGTKDVLKAYANTTLEPWKINSFNDILSIPYNMGGAYTTIASDLFSRLFKKK